MSMNCSEIRAILPAYVKEGEASLDVRRHLPGCPGCSEELARYRSVVGGLEELGRVTLEAPSGLVLALCELPFEGGSLEKVKSHLARNRPGYLVSGLALGATGAAGAALWYLRRGRAIAA